MSWTCAAIDHGVTFYQNRTITPCCFIDWSYKKDIKDIGNDPFADLRTDTAPSVCNKCIDAEESKFFKHHYKSMFKNQGVMTRE